MKSQQRQDTAKYKHNCILLHKATPNTAVTTDKLKVQWERGKKESLSNEEAMISLSLAGKQRSKRLKKQRQLLTGCWKKVW